MSILDDVSTPDFLSARLIEITKSIKADQDVSIYKKNALLIENFLNKIIGNQIQVDENNPIEDLTQDLYDNALNNLGIDINYWTKRKNKAYGIKFEKFFHELLRDIFNHSQNDLVGATWDNKKGHITSIGAKTTNPLQNITDEIIDDTTKNTMELAYKRIAEELDKQTKKSEIKNHTLNKVQGKIDTVSHHINFQISIDDPVLQKILPLLANATFSDKAYENAGDVKIGQTNSFRVFLAISGDMSAKDKIKRWYRMLNCMEYHSEENAAQKFYELRYIYELTGYGLQYTKQWVNKMLGNDAGADYLIYFHKGRIKVLSTAAIINEFLADSTAIATAGRTLTDGTITKEYALYAKLKLRMTNGRFKLGEF